MCTEQRGLQHCMNQWQLYTKVTMSMTGMLSLQERDGYRPGSSLGTTLRNATKAR